MDEELLLDRIYEAGALPELWPDALHQVAVGAGAPGALLLAPQADKLHWQASEGLHDMTLEYLQGGHAQYDERKARLLAYDHPGFVVDTDIFTLEEWEADPVRTNFFAPRGFGWGVSSVIKLPTDQLFIFMSERRIDQGPFRREDAERLDNLRPHLARAALMSARVDFERSKSAVSALEIVGIPAAVLDEKGRLLVSNELFEKLVPDTFQPRNQRLCLTNPNADKPFVTALDALRVNTATGIAQSIPLPATPGQPPMIVHLHPVRRSARDVFTRAFTIVLATPLGNRAMPPSSLIQALLDLTPAEANVARGLGAGSSISEVAQSVGVSTSTVRNQVKMIFSKTGMNRQSELVGFLRGVAASVDFGKDES